MVKLTLVPHIPRRLLALIESTAAYEESSGLRIADGVREFLLRTTRRNGPRSVEIWLCDCAQDRSRRDRTMRIQRSTGFRRACRNRLQHLARLPGKGVGHPSCNGLGRFCGKLRAGQNRLRAHPSGNECFHTRPPEMRIEKNRRDTRFGK
jgi:hypothetical protein